METKTELYKAIAAVMSEVKGIDKSMTVGTGTNTYKGVSDKDVKQIIGASMEKHGLICVPKEYRPTMTIERWQEVDPYSKSTPKDLKTKQSVFVEMQAVFLMIHVETGQSIEIPAYGHGVDSQDKAAGKATTYALKYALLYSFLVPTGSIDDTDKTHSDEQPTPKAAPKPQAPAPAPKAKKKVETEQQFTDLVNWIQSGKGTLTRANELYILTEKQYLDLEEIVNSNNK